MILSRARPMALVRYASVGALALLGSATGGCGVGCTLVGCTSGLTVRLEPAPSVPYSVEVISSGTSARYVFRCNAPGRCSDAFFPYYFVSRAAVEVITSADTLRSEFANIRYDKVQPNGEKCDPTCRNAYLTVQTPATLLARP